MVHALLKTAKREREGGTQVIIQILVSFNQIVRDGKILV